MGSLTLAWRFFMAITQPGGEEDKRLHTLTARSDKNVCVHEETEGEVTHRSMRDREAHSMFDCARFFCARSCEEYQRKNGASSLCAGVPRNLQYKHSYEIFVSSSLRGEKKESACSLAFWRIR